MMEPLPLATIHDTVLEFLRNRTDCALFGAQAVNAYVDESRMTQDVDILSTRAPGVADELRAHLAEKFKIAVRVPEVASGQAFRVYQLRHPKNRHLADVRQVNALPPTQLVADVLVPTPEELIAQKVISYAGRRGQPKAGTDWRDLTFLLLAFPQLKSNTSPVADRLAANHADAAAIEEWRKLVALKIDDSESEDAGWKR